MAYEFSTEAFLLRLIRRKRQWIVQFNGYQNGDRRSPEAAAIAVARYEPGLAEWDRGRFCRQTIC